MNRKTFTIMMALAALAVIAVPLYVIAQDTQGCKWWQDQKAAKELNLTKQETDKLDQQFVDHRKKMADLRAQVEKERIDLRAMMESGKDETALAAQFGKLEAAKSALSKERFSHMMDSRKTLGAERFMKLGMLDDDRGPMMKNCPRGGDRDRDRDRDGMGPGKMMRDRGPERPCMKGLPDVD